MNKCSKASPQEIWSAFFDPNKSMVYYGKHFPAAQTISSMQKFWSVSPQGRYPGRVFVD